MSVGVWTWVLWGLWLAVTAALCLKIALLRLAAREIREGIRDRLGADTNTLLTVGSRDRAMRALAEELNEELRALRRQRRRYEQGNLALKEAVTNISHDIRTPLTAISGYLELLEREEKSENIDRYLKIIRERTETLSRLTEELFLYTVAVSAGEDGEARRPLQGTADDRVTGAVKGGERNREKDDGGETAADLRSVLEESVLAEYGALSLRGIEPELHLPETEVKCRINIRITSRIFENILNNALKYSDGDLKITLDERGEVIFANHAAALDEVQVGRLFDRFYTVENGKTATGLGLAIARELTEQSGGSIGAWYAEGMLYLRVRFPLAPISLRGL